MIITGLGLGEGGEEAWGNRNQIKPGFIGIMKIKMKMKMNML